jgi:hypothetical protein
MTDDDRINKLVQAVDQNTAAIKRLETAILEFAKVHKSSVVEFLKVHEASIRTIIELHELEKRERDDPEAR